MPTGALNQRLKKQVRRDLKQHSGNATFRFLVRKSVDAVCREHACLREIDQEPLQLQTFAGSGTNALRDFAS